METLKNNLDSLAREVLSPNWKLFSWLDKPEWLNGRSRYSFIVALISNKYPPVVCQSIARKKAEAFRNLVSYYDIGDNFKVYHHRVDGDGGYYKVVFEFLRVV